MRREGRSDVPGAGHRNRSGADGRSGSLDDLLRLAYPDGLDADRRDLAHELAGGADPFDASVARRILGGFEQQVGGPRLTIRFGPDDVEIVDVAGMRLALDRADASVSVQIRDGSYEPHVAAVLRSLLSKGAAFVDVGANVGFHSFSAAAAIGPAGHVLAVEANPENARLIAYSVGLNDIEHVEILPLALSDRRGYAHFTSHIGSNGGFIPSTTEALASGQGFVVPTMRLDDLGLERIDVMKIDVEGAESLVIAGGLATLERLRPAIIAEFSFEMVQRVSGMAAADYIAMLTELDYDLHVIDRESHEPALIPSVERFVGEWGDRARIEDLLFLPAEREIEPERAH